MYGAALVLHSLLLNAPSSKLRTCHCCCTSPWYRTCCMQHPVSSGIRCTVARLCIAPVTLSPILSPAAPTPVTVGVRSCGPGAPCTRTPQSVHGLSPLVRYVHPALLIVVPLSLLAAAAAATSPPAVAKVNCTLIPFGPYLIPATIRLHPQSWLPRLLQQHRPQLIFFQAGVDALKGDR